MNEFFNTAFIYTRNKYILPRIKYGIPVEKSNYWRLKNIISERIQSISSTTNVCFNISLKKEDYFKLIFCESELFLNKSFIQLNDYHKLIDKSSGSWSFVTLYYSLFFNLSCLLRFLNKGYVYLTPEYAKKISDAYLALNSSPIKISYGNYFFETDCIDDGYGNIKISFNKVDTTHKVIWEEFKKALQTLSSQATDRELAIYKVILSHFNKYQNSYPSALRNELNYNAETILLDFHKEITCYHLPKIDDKFYQSFLKIDDNNPSISNKIKSITYISSYIFSLNLKLAEEFYNRSDFGKDFVKMRKKIS